MLPEDIDDLFRDKLDGHETPPGDALWARLQATPAPEVPETTDQRLDQLFRAGLSTHATPPARELWERLEDEHLRPRKRRAAAWWPMALAAAVVLFLLAGGAGLWLGFPGRSTSHGTLATKNQSATQARRKERLQAPATSTGPKAEQTTVAPTVAEGTIAVAGAGHKDAPNRTQPLEMASSPSVQKNISSQATRSATLASTAPKARMSALGQSPRHPLRTSRQPDAATDAPSLVARTTPRAAAHPAPRTLPTPTSTAADEQQPPLAPVVAQAPSPVTDTALEIVPANASELITVDVRNGAAPGSRPARPVVSALAAAEESAGRRSLGGRLLQQAGHLVRGERLSLAEATGLPENVTLRATVAGRTVSKSIRL
ncbi:hypothetical protein [Hymenobacter rubidus]|uniref:hypothetical protein n=1 Tax=Hymenobacter rubidus TaxID=1441626 RepID=UPI00191EA6DA|nr:hypothetical protein [Hymenobacter rubidus]